MNEIVDRPIAIGYLVFLSQELIEKIKNILPECYHDNIPNSVHIATKFIDGQKGMTKDIMKNEEDMIQWYKKKKGSIYKCYIDNLLVSPNKNVLATVANCNGEKTYGILYNKNNIPTTPLKKAISSGKHDFSKITFDRLSMNCEPYIFNIPHRKYIFNYNGRKKIVYEKVKND